MKANQSDVCATLCTKCEKGTGFEDTLACLYATKDGQDRAVLTKAKDNAITISPFVVLWKDYLPDLPLVAKSASNGCDFCNFLLSNITSREVQDEVVRLFGESFVDLKAPLEVTIQIQHRWKNELERDNRGSGLLGAVILLTFEDSPTEITLFCLAEGLTGRWWWANQDFQSVLESGKLTMLVGHELSDIWLGLGTPPDQSYTTEECMGWITKTFNHDYQHRNENLTRPYTPKRLINVVEQLPRLEVQSKGGNGGFSQPPIYAALSYCWGPAEDAKMQLKTTRASLFLRQQGIREHEMTDVLRDAVAVTRALAIPYLWVDALCILQDDITDWESQCSQVANLYANAAITIGAGSSTTCRQGFLRQRGAGIRMPFHSVRNPGISGSYYLRFKYVGYPRDQVFNQETADSQYSRWGSRGWVFQESNSASRKLLFGNSNLHFYSRSAIHSMGCQAERTQGVSPLSSLEITDRNHLHKSWAHVVAEYSKFEENSFTKVKDILPALSGVASKYHDLLLERYHAGLWEGDLFRGLMWYWSGSSETLPSRACCSPGLLMRHDNCPVPSWSPLGRGMFVTYGAIYREDECYTDFQPEYTRLQASTSPIGSNPFGEIGNNSALTITSYVLSLATLDARKLEIDDTFAEPECRGTLLYEGKHLGYFELDFAYEEFDQDDSHSSASDLPASMMGEVSSFSWVLLGSCKVSNTNEKPRRVRRARGACGLILYSIPNSTKFCRVGVFFPGEPEKHHDGLSLIKRLGRVEHMVII